MRKSIIDEVATFTNKAPDEVNEIIECFLEQLHKRSYEDNHSSYTDYIHGLLHADISSKALYHFFGVLYTYADKQADDCTSENIKAYISHTMQMMGSKEHWLPFVEQMKQWKKPTKD